MENAQEPTQQVRIRKAQAEDLPQIWQILQPLVESRTVLRRTRAETQKLFETGFVAEAGPEIAGVAAVEIYSKKLAEIQCLAVQEDFRGQGLGRQLVQACVDLAREYGVMEVMAISSSDRFLMDVGFDYSLPNQKRALFFQLRSRDDVFDELEGLDDN